jgi:hypothetical protein
MFRSIILPIFRNTRLCVTACGIMHQRCFRPSASSVHYTTSCKHSLMLLKTGEIIARHMLNWLELLINRYCCIYLVVNIIVLVTHAHTSTNIKYGVNSPWISWFYYSWPKLLFWCGWDMFSFWSLCIQTTLTTIYYSIPSHIILPTFFCLISCCHVTFFPHITVFACLLCNDPFS